MECPINIIAERNPKQGVKFKASFSTRGDYGGIGPPTHHMEIMAEGKKDLDHDAAWTG